MTPILETIPTDVEVHVWDNSKRPYDAGVFGRYLVLHETGRPVVVFQDDDCLVDYQLLLDNYLPGIVTGIGWGTDRMNRYADTTLLGWGSIFDRELPWQAFQRYARHRPFQELLSDPLGAEIVFPMLSRPRTVMVSQIRWLEEDGPVYQRQNRMWKQDGFYDRVDHWLKIARQVSAVG